MCSIDRNELLRSNPNKVLFTRRAKVEILDERNVEVIVYERAVNDLRIQGYGRKSTFELPLVEGIKDLSELSGCLAAMTKRGFICWEELCLILLFIGGFTDNQTILGVADFFINEQTRN